MPIGDEVTDGWGWVEKIPVPIIVVGTDGWGWVEEIPVPITVVGTDG